MSKQCGLCWTSTSLLRAWNIGSMLGTVSTWSQDWQIQLEHRVRNAFPWYTFYTHVVQLARINHGGDSTGREFWRYAWLSSRPAHAPFLFVNFAFILATINYKQPWVQLYAECLRNHWNWRWSWGPQYDYGKELEQNIKLTKSYFFALSFMWERILGKITPEATPSNTLFYNENAPVTCFTVTFLAQEETHKKQYST